MKRVAASGIAIAVYLFFVIFPGAVGAQLSSASDEGQKLYAQKCASCHGKKGQGTEEYSTPLEGGLSLAQLTSYVHETMPEDDPGTLSESEAAAVSRFVYESMYSAIARERNRPARVELSRLTVNQYRQTVTDLVSGFIGSAQLDERIGLEGKYVEGRNLWKKKVRQEVRLDSQIDFNFGDEPPVEAVRAGKPYTIMWTGSLFAPETGKYKISISSPDAVRVWVNGKTPLIDAWVKSETKDEAKGEIFLVAGRYYPIVVEYAKATQGVVREVKKEKKRDGKISLRWKRPHSTQTVIPERYFVPVKVSPSYMCDVPFPPDDNSYGWARSSSISKEWDRATTLAALHAANFITERIDRLARTKAKDPKRGGKIKAFCQTFVKRAFRGPPDKSMVSFVENQLERSKDEAAVENAIRRIVLLTLKSPRFLYREVDAAQSSHHVASRLSYVLWDSMPDKQLLQAVERNQLDTEDQIRKQADRLLSDLRSRQKLMDFFRTWLQIDKEHSLIKDDQRYPGFDADTMSDLRESLELGLHELVTSPTADYRDLIQGDRIFVNQRLAKLFGIDEKPGAWFKPMEMEPDHRAGVLTHPYLLAQFAYSSESSPIHRGVFIARNVLGKKLRPPPEAFAPIPPDLHKELTTRERVSLQTQAAECMACHQIINPLGFTLEHFDAVGRFRNDDNNKQVDTHVEYDFGDSKSVTIRNANDLAEHILTNETAQQAFCERLFQYMVGQPLAAYGTDTRQRLHRFFVTHEFNVRLLAREIGVIAAMKNRDSKK